MGFSDKTLANYGNVRKKIYAVGKRKRIMPVYKMVEHAPPNLIQKPRIFTGRMKKKTSRPYPEKKSVIVLGSGPIRIGQGIEFDYATVHAVWAIKEAGYEAIIINNNPETVSTDFSISDKSVLRAVDN